MLSLHPKTMNNTQSQWIEAFKQFLSENPKQDTYDSYDELLKDMLSDLMIVSAFADTAELKAIIRYKTIEKILTTCKKAESFASFRNDPPFLTKLQSVMTRLVNQAAIQEELFLKNRLFSLMSAKKTDSTFMEKIQNKFILQLLVIKLPAIAKEMKILNSLSQNSVPYFIQELKLGVPQVISKLDVKNYAFNTSYIELLHQWGLENFSEAKKTTFLNQQDKKKNTKSKNAMKLLSNGNMYQRISLTFFFLSTLSISFLPYGFVIALVPFFLSCIYAKKSTDDFKASGLVDPNNKKFTSEWRSSVDHFINITFAEPNAKLDSSFKIDLTVKTLEHINYAITRAPESSSTHSYHKLIDKPANTAVPEAKKIIPLEPESKSTELYSNIQFYNKTHLSFVYQNKNYQAYLDEDALPIGEEGTAIVNAFNKGPMRGGESRSAHAIVRAAQYDICLFKIRTSYNGRLKSSHEEVDEKNTTLVFDIYDPKHDRKRLKGAGHRSVTS